MTIAPAKKYKPLKSKPLVSDYPHCAGRGLILTHFDGKSGSQHRLDSSKWATYLTKSLTPEQRERWFAGRYADGSGRLLPDGDRDNMGYLPDRVETFLVSLVTKSFTSDGPPPVTSTDTEAVKTPLAEDAAMAATATKKKVAKKKPAAGAKLANDPSNGKFDPAQKALPGMEAVRVEKLDKLIERIVKRDAAQMAAKNEAEVETERDLTAIGNLLRENSMEKYQSNGKIAFIKHGIDAVEIKKAPKPKKPK